MSYPHEVAGEQGITSNQKDAKRKGFQVHSVLLLDAAGENTVVLIEQSHWCRERKNHGKKHTRKQRAYEDKESYKWEQASAHTAERLGATMAHTISVCDRESDVYEYLDYKLRHTQRFVIRAKVDRRVLHGDQTLFVTLSRAVGFDQTQRTTNNSSIDSLGLSGSGETRRIYRYHAHWTSWMGYDVARLVSLARATCWLSNEQAGACQIAIKRQGRAGGAPRVG